MRVHRGYFLETKREGQWDDSVWPSCGTGLVEKVISGGKKAVLMISTHGIKDAFHFYLQLTDTITKKSSLLLLYERPAAAVRLP